MHEDGMPAQAVHGPRWTARFDRVVILLVLVTILGLGLRLYDLGGPSLWYDEGFTVRLAELIGQGVDVFDTANNMEAPFPSAATYVWGRITFADHLPLTSPYRDFLLRLLTALCSTACIPILYAVGVITAGNRYAGLAAAFLFAISPFHIFYAQELRSYAFTTLFGVSAMYFFVRALDTNRHRFYLALMFMFVLMMYTHFTNVWPIVAFNLVALVAILQRRVIFWRWTAYQAAMLILVAPAVKLAFEANQLWLRIKYPWPNNPFPTPKLALITFKTFFAGYGPTAWAYWPLFLLALVFTVLGIIALRRRWRNALLLALLIGFPIAVNVVFWRMRDLSLYEHRVFIFSGAVALVAIGSGICALPRPVLRWGAVAAIAALSVPGLYDYYAKRLHPIVAHRVGIFDKVDFRTAADYIRNHWHDGDILAHDSNFTVLSMLHYLPVEQYHLGSDRDAAIYVKHVAPEDLLRRHQLLPVPPEIATAGAKRVWLLEAFGTTFDDEPQTIAARDWLGDHFTLAESKELDGLRLLRYDRRQPKVPPARKPL